MYIMYSPTFASHGDFRRFSNTDLYTNTLYRIVNMNFYFLSFSFIRYRLLQRIFTAITNGQHSLLLFKFLEAQLALLKGYLFSLFFP